jgi:RimJ/RimL family protein N-acetyltransferase
VRQDGGVAGPEPEGVRTARLVVRSPREADRARFIELFRDADFMAFYPEAFTVTEASERFDHMVAVCRAVPFGKQPVVERSSGLIVGYTGVDHIAFEGRTWLEWGYRLIPERRGRGYATEASRALLAGAQQTYRGELLAIIAPGNLASQNVAAKLGFAFWKQAPVDGDLRNLYTLTVSQSGRWAAQAGQNKSDQASSDPVWERTCQRSGKNGRNRVPRR